MLPRPFIEYLKDKHKIYAILKRLVSNLHKYTLLIVSIYLHFADYDCDCIQNMCITVLTFI